MIGLVDCNNFFVSCERTRDITLLDKPVLVLSSNDGCVISRSNEAKAMGIPMGIPVFKIKREIERHKMILRSSDHRFYRTISNKVMKILEEEAPRVDVYSIDEAFLDLDMVAGDREVFARKVIERLKRETGIPVSIGIASTKTLAKLASHHAKKHPECNGVFTWGEEDYELMQHLPVNEIWGIGRRYAKMLESNGKYTVLDFYQSTRSWIRQSMTVQGERTWLELHGEACHPFNEVEEPQKSISHSRSFGEAVTSLEVLKEIVAQFTGSCARQLRNQKTQASSISVYIMNNRFDTANFYLGHKEMRLPAPTDSTVELTRCALECLSLIFRPGIRYKKAGVIISNITETAAVQGNLFDQINRVKQQKVQQAVDKIMTKHGSDKIHLAIQGDGSSLKIKHEYPSAEKASDKEK